MDEELGDTNIFRITKDASGAPVYMHNNVAVPKDVFDQKNQASINQMNAMRNSVTPGIDDDPEFMAMKAKVQAKQAAMAAAKKAIPKAKGGSISLKDCKVSTHQKNSKHSGW